MRIFGQKAIKVRSKLTGKLHWVLTSLKSKRCIIFPVNAKKTSIKEFGKTKKVFPAHIIKKKTLNKLFIKTTP